MQCGQTPPHSALNCADDPHNDVDVETHFGVHSCEDDLPLLQ